jgi:hypothetical protein
MIAALLVALAFGTGQAEARTIKVAHWQPACVPRRTRRCRRPHRMRPVRLVAPPPPAPGSPAPAPPPAPTPDPPRYPTRTSVDLTDDDENGWRVTPAYRVLGAGTVEFNATNLGMDEHDFSIRAGDLNLATLPLLSGESGTVRVVMGPGVYTLYCSLPGHEELGMRTDITVR